MANQWCRLYRETITDPKLSRLTACQRHVWTVLMCLAIDGDGVVQIADGIGYTHDEIAQLAAATDDDVTLALDWFKRAGMVELGDGGVMTLVNWDSRQFKSDTSAERTRKYRERLKRHCDVTVTDQNRTEQNRTETDQSKKRARKFTPPTLDEVRTYCAERDNDVDAEAWYAHYEANGWMVGRNKMKSWQAAVRTWERNEFGGAKQAKKANKVTDAGRHDGSTPWHVDDVRKHQDHARWDEYMDAMAGKPGPWPRFERWLDE